MKNFSSTNQLIDNSCNFIECNYIYIIFLLFIYFLYFLTSFLAPCTLSQKLHRTGKNLALTFFLRTSLYYDSVSTLSRSGHWVIHLSKESDSRKTPSCRLYCHRRWFAHWHRMAKGRRHTLAGHDAFRPESSSHRWVHQLTSHLKPRDCACWKLQLPCFKCCGWGG